MSKNNIEFKATKKPIVYTPRIWYSWTDPIDPNKPTPEQLIKGLKEEYGINQSERIKNKSR